MGKEERDREKDRERDRERERERDKEKKREREREKEKEKEKDKKREKERDKDRGREKEKKKKDKSKKHYDSDSSDSSNQSSSNSDSESDSDSSSHHKKDKKKSKEKLSQKEIEERKKLKKEEKLLTKLTETPEQRRKRRLEKKRLKHAKKKQDEELIGYTNDANPFGDPNLLSTFQWHKKNEIVAKNLGVSKEDIEKEKEKSRHRDLKAEILRIKKIREKREEEKRKWEEERARMAREAEGMDGLDWEKKEEIFHFEQSKLRSKIRLQESRAKPIDILAKNVEFSPNEFEIEVNEPYRIFAGLQLSELNELRQDIKQRLDFGHAAEYWNSLLIVCDDEIMTAKGKQEMIESKSVRYGASGLHHMIEPEIISSLTTKTYSQLTKLEESIKRKLSEGGIDTEYWEALLRRVNVQKAKARLTNLHAELLVKRLNTLQNEQYQRQVEKRNKQRMVDEYEQVKLEEEIQAELKKQEERKSKNRNNDNDDDIDLENLRPSKRQKTERNEEEEEEEEEEEKYEAPKRKQNQEENENKVEITGNIDDNEEEEEECYSPKPIKHIGEEEIAESPSDDEAEIIKLRQSVINKMTEQLKLTSGGNNDANRNDSADKLYQEEARKGMETGDSAFNIEVSLDPTQQVYWWHDKYRPRKPRYFNRVHTGFEWNKYNQTHYDYDNPPPKIVQGYKFNIFYPDLIDPTKTPSFKLLPGENPDTAIVVFHAGPPYEDIAFKVVNKEWDYARRSGFKCTFERGILHLCFNFKRLRYRR